jgi:hypothetical protein
LFFYAGLDTQACVLFFWRRHLSGVSLDPK